MRPSHADFGAYIKIIAVEDIFREELQHLLLLQVHF